MSTSSLATSIRSKKLGVLLRNARLVRHKSIEDCAQALAIAPDTWQSYELGEQSPSLPEIELFAYYLDLPVEHFWRQTGLLDPHDNRRPVEPQQLLTIRQRVVGVLLRRSRVQAQLTVDELAEKTGIPLERLKEYEMGQPIPLPDLEALAMALDISVRQFLDLSGPVGIWFARQRAVKDFQDLSPELQSFVVKPINRPFIELAQRLSEMDVSKLRTVAEGLLEITL
jgi:transcriptional regulator with XRE-family HTH domain